MMYKTKTYSAAALTLILFLLAGLGAYSQEIKGVVTDFKTGEPMTGATVMIKETSKVQYVQLDGKFSFKNIKPGSYSLEITFTNYKTIEKPVSVIANKVSTLQVQLEPEAVELSDVVVMANGSTSDRNVRNLEKNSNQLVNIVSSHNIELLPDITVANVMQRVSGVTIEKNTSGEARFPIIRGMEKRYINTLVNGIKIPSPDNKNRFIPLDLFPSELLERLEVSKSLTPSMEGDAIGGTINLVMKDAPATKLMQANVATGYNNIFADQPFLQFDKGSINKKSPAEINGPTYQATPSDFPVKQLNYTNHNGPVNTILGLTLGNRFGANKKLGILFSGSYQNIHSGTQSTFFLPNAQPSLNNFPGFIDLYARQYSTDNRRLGLNAKVDYKINSRNKISWFNTFVRLGMLQTRLNSDTIVLNSLITESYRSTWQYQSIYNSTLQGIHKLSSTFSIDWSAGYSIANNHIPDQASFSHQFQVMYDAGSKTYSRVGDIVQGMSRDWMHNSDKDLFAYLNFTEQTKLLDKPYEVKLGGMFRNKKRDNFYNSYSLNPQQGNTGNQAYTNINDAVYTFTGSNATPDLNGNNYTFSEDIAAGYVQGKWNLSSKLEMLGGVRVESTRQKYETELSESTPAKSGTITYTDALPSAQLKYTVKQNQAIRFSYYRAIARPQFSELIPDGPSNYETFKEVGNPVGLKHSLADNLDLRYELFPGKGADQVLVGVFYKKIQDPIEFSAVKSGPTSQVLKPINIGDATNYGLELVVTKYFGKFGISANYTYTQSKVTNDSMLYYYFDNNIGYTTKYVSETRPLQGQANNIGNVSLIYKNARIGLDAQLAFTYTGEQISLVSPYAGLHYWQQPYSGLDFSLDKRITKRLTFYTKMKNLTNSPIAGSLHVPYNTYITTPGSRLLSLQNEPGSKIIVQKNYVKSSFLFGLRFKL
jgi:outer membrane receptor protein involved in Fe transport